MHFLVTGSQGFIGSFLTRALLTVGHTVTGLDISAGSTDGPGYRFIRGSILDREALRKALEGVACIIHLATEHKDRGISERQYFEVNETGTRTVLECASEAGIGKVVFFSTAAVYGQPGKATEEREPHPATAYGASKLKAEAEIETWVSGNSRRAAIVIRPSSVFGPENYANIYRLISRVCDGKFIWIGKGDNVKSVAYVENLVAATGFLIDRLEPGLQVCNYSDEPQLKMRQLVELISEKAQVPVAPFHIPYSIAVLTVGVLEALSKMTGRDSEITTGRLRKFHMHSEYPAGKIRSLGFHQKYTLEEGIERTVRWYNIIKS